MEREVNAAAFRASLNRVQRRDESARDATDRERAQRAAWEEATGAGIMDCKKALEQAHGNMEKAKAWLRDRGVAIAATKGGRMAKEGLIGSYIHAGGKLGVLVELNSETDFVARTEDFQNLLRELCMQIAAASPRWVSRDLVPPEILEQKKQEFEKEALKENKPQPVAAKIAEGKLKEFYATFCLLEQPFVKEPKLTVGQLVQEKIALIKENIVVRRFARYRKTAGHLAQTFCLVATWLGLAPFTTAAIVDTDIERTLGIDGVEETILYVAGVGMPKAVRATRPAVAGRPRASGRKRRPAS